MGSYAVSRFWPRFAALLLAALSFALSFAHLMELAPRLRWTPDLWIAATVFGGLYTLFGSVGSVIDVAALLVLAWLSWLAREEASRFAVWTATGLFVIAHALWWGAVAPMNAILATWRPGALPVDFAEVRNQWGICPCGDRAVEGIRLCGAASGRASGRAGAGIAG